MLLHQISSPSPTTSFALPICGIGDDCHGQLARQQTIRVLAIPVDTMAQVDIAAARRACGRVVTVAVNKFQFHKPAYVGDLVSCYAHVVRVGNTSITVFVECLPNAIAKSAPPSRSRKTRSLCGPGRTAQAAPGAKMRVCYPSAQAVGLRAIQHMTRRFSHLSGFLICAYLLAALAGCATPINKEHPMIVTQPDVAAANVYFIRPMTYRERGIADNLVKIELNGMELLKLGKGEYTLLRVRPEKVLLKTRNLTPFTNKDDYVEMTRELRLELTPGQTYFIHIRQVNEEFRGVYYLPMPVDLKAAKNLILDARSARIDTLSL